MKNQPVLSPTRPRETTLPFLLAVVLLTGFFMGCDPIQNAGPQSETASNSEAKKEQAWEQWIGTWQGVSIKNSNGSFSPATRASHSIDGEGLAGEVKAEFLLEIEERFLSIPGIESCHLSLTSSVDGDVKNAKRSSFRMIADETAGNVFNLRGSGGQYQISMMESGEVMLQGKPRYIYPLIGTRLLTASLQKEAHGSH